MKNCHDCKEKEKRIAELEELTRRMAATFDAMQIKAKHVSNVMMFPVQVDVKTLGKAR